MQTQNQNQNQNQVTGGVLNQNQNQPRTTENGQKPPPKHIKRPKIAIWRRNQNQKQNQPASKTQNHLWFEPEPPRAALPTKAQFGSGGWRLEVDPELQSTRLPSQPVSRILRILRADMRGVEGVLR